MEKHKTKEEKQEILAQAEKLHEAGLSWKEAARRVGVYGLTLARWKKNGSKPPEVREIKHLPGSGTLGELKRLRVENTRLRMMMVDLMLDKQALIEYSGRS